jgi:glycosyltransferase involved in cell wall biosynthesis
LKSCAEDFESEAVLTVVHGYSWLLAARYARRHGLPLHLIIHDDWVRSLHLPWVMMRWLERRFASVYRGASSRLCVSPSMAQQFQSSYGVAGVVLYPARGKDCPIFDDPPARLEKISSTFVAAYAGASLRAEGNRGPLADVAKALIPIGGRLLIYGPYSADDLKSMELDLPNVDLKGLVPSSELIVMLREEAHLLIAQMSFLAEDSYLMATCFPSRLADYTAVGIPILIYAPPSSSAVRWAQENAGAAIVIHRRDVASIQKLVQELSTNADLRWSLGSRALEVGQKYFSEQTAWLVLRQSLNPNAS